MSRRQLHESETERSTMLWAAGRRSTRIGSARSCEMEALGVTLHRVRSNLLKASKVWVSERRIAKPNTRSRPGCSGGGVARNFAHLTRGDLLRSPIVDRGRWVERKDYPPTCQEKSDRLVVVQRPGNAGGAKGATE